jgi:hypothetical protein
MWSLVYLFLSLLFLFFVIWLTTSKKGKGIAGELVVSRYLNKLDKSKYFVINDITLKLNDRTTQIDHIVVSCYGIFVIETKNWKGSIYGGSRNNYLYQYLGGVKYKHQNPIKQNIGHIKFLREVLSNYHNLTFFSIVAFSDYSKRKINRDTSIAISDILDTIEEYEEEVISELDRDRVYTKLERLKIEGDKYKEEHVENMRRRYGK